MSEQRYRISEFFVLKGFSGFVHRSGVRLSVDEMVRRGYSPGAGSRPALGTHLSVRRDNR
jgi:hypothetical protein